MRKIPVLSLVVLAFNCDRATKQGAQQNQHHHGNHVIIGNSVSVSSTTDYDDTVYTTTTGCYKSVNLWAQKLTPVVFIVAAVCPNIFKLKVPT